MSDEIVYVCNRCGETFTLEEGKRLKTEEGLFTICPNCGDDDIEEGERCPVCKEIHYEWDFTGGVCKNCFADAVSAFKACLGYLQPWEREALEDHYGNIDITEE